MATLKDQIDRYLNKGICINKENNSEFYNFFDWFCEDEELEDRAKTLFEFLIRYFIPYFKIDTNNYYCFFKCNCPIYGDLYDSISICDNSGSVVYWMTPLSGHSNLIEIYEAPNFNTPIISATTLNELLKKLQNKIN